MFQRKPNNKLKVESFIEIQHKKVPILPCVFVARHGTHWDRSSIWKWLSIGTKIGAIVQSGVRLIKIKWKLILTFLPLINSYKEKRMWLWLTLIGPIKRQNGQRKMWKISDRFSCVSWIKKTLFAHDWY